MAELIHAMDWTGHQLGNPNQWSQTLRSAVSICLNARLPMSVMWGDELTMIYNDAYAELIGDKHPAAMGAKAADVWSETWSQVGITILDVLHNGTATWAEDQLLVIERKGFSETCFFTSSYSAIRNDCGIIDGVFCALNETSQRVRAVAHALTENTLTSIQIEESEIALKTFNLNLEESEERFRSLADNMPLFAFIIEPNEDATVSYWNKTWLDYTGQSFDEAMGRAWDGIIHPEDLPGIMEVYVPAFKKREPYLLPPIRVKRYDGMYRWHMAKSNPRYLPDGTFLGYIGVGFDIHESKLAMDALKESEERLRNLVDKAPSPICILKGENMVLEVANEPVYKVWGVDKSVLGKPFLEIIPEMKDQPFMGYLLDVYHKGITHYGNEQPAYFKRSNGETETIYFNFVYQPYRENDGTISGVMVMATDVTEQVVSRKKMEQQASMVNNLLMTAPAFICTLTGKDHVYDLINARYQKMFGTRILKNKAILEALPELAGQGFDTLLDNVYNTGETYVGIDIPIKLAKDEGLAPELCYFNFSYQPMYNEHGEIYSILVFGYEVTDKALFNQKIKESENHFRQMADLMPSKVSSATPDGGVTYFNKEWLNYTEMNFEELRDFGYHNIIHPDEISEFQQLLAQAAIEGKALEMEMRIKDKQGEYIWHINRATPVIDDNGKITMWLGVTSNIHSHKMQEEELEQAVVKRTIELKEANEKLHFESEEKEKRTAELSIANSELLFQNEENEKKAVELVIANKELQAFTFISSHDLQEPLRKIQTYSALILATDHAQLSERGKHNFLRIEASAKRMQALIRDLLSYSHTNITDRKFEDTHLNIIIDEVKNDLAESMLEKNAVIETNSLCTLNIIPFQFRQLLLNLVANTLKFSKPTVPVHIKITSKISTGLQFLQQTSHAVAANLLPGHKYCCITFSDNGIGFNPQFRDKIFEVFQRLNSRDDYEGTGIGLAIVKKIVENHNGFITATGELNKGATFHIYIPVKDEVPVIN